MVVAAAAAPVGYMADVATTAAAECVRGKCYWVRERKLMVLWREVENRNKNKQGRHRTNEEINEQIAIKKLNEHEKFWGWGWRGGGGRRRRSLWV